MNYLKITPEDFTSIFQDDLSDFVKIKIRQSNFLAEKISDKKRDEVLLDIIRTLNSPKVIQAGKHRRLQWEKGWTENLESLKDSGTLSITPRYFGKYKVIRWKQEFLKPISKNFEFNMLAIIEYWLFDKYLRSFESIYEFGCGTGHNLLRVREINRKAQIVGLDWAKSSQKIIKKIAIKNGDSRLNAKRFDFFSPDKKFRLDKNCAVFTVAALEQLGNNFKPFLDYLLVNQPKICIHIEPIGELLDENNLVDNLSLLYFEKRNYLNGFLPKLQELEKKKKIKIHLAKRTYIGSLFIEGYSVIVWSPI